MLSLIRSLVFVAFAFGFIATVLAITPTPTPTPTPTNRTVRFAWNASTGQVLGYKIFWGTGSGNYQHVLDVKNVLNASLTLPSASSSYVAVSAYNLSQTSMFSNEVIVRPVSGAW